MKNAVMAVARVLMTLVLVTGVAILFESSGAGASDITVSGTVFAGDGLPLATLVTSYTVGAPVVDDPIRRWRASSEGPSSADGRYSIRGNAEAGDTLLVGALWYGGSSIRTYRRVRVEDGVVAYSVDLRMPTIEPAHGASRLRIKVFYGEHEIDYTAYGTVATVVSGRIPDGGHLAIVTDRNGVIEEVTGLPTGPYRIVCNAMRRPLSAEGPWLVGRVDATVTDEVTTAECHLSI